MNYGTAIQEADYGSKVEQSPMTKVKKPGFLKRWLLKSVKEAVDSERQYGQALEASSIVKRRGIGLDSGGAQIDQPERALHFTIYVANGGRVIETRRYDKQKDRNTNGLYVINNDADFGKEIDKIITMEALRG